MRALLLAFGLAVAACGSDSGQSTSTTEDGGTPITGSDGGVDLDSGTVVPPTTASCSLEPLADVTGATMVASEAELRAALTAGGKVKMSRDITATAPFDIGKPVVLDGGGFTLSGGGTTHLLVARMTDLVVQNITMRDARNVVPASQHFSRQSGAAIMIHGGNGTTDGPARGSLKVIKATFLGNRAEMVSNGDIRGGAVYLFNLPNATFSEATFRGNVAVSGGAIGGLGSSLSIAATVFEGNQGNNAGRGGVLDGTGGAVSLDALSQNKQTAYFKICGSVFKDNRAVRLGGAIYYVNHWKTGSEVEIRQTSFLGNATSSTTEGQGGAIFAMDDDKYPQNTGAANRTSVTESLFAGNATWGQGGGLWYWTKEGSLLVRNATFHANTTNPAHDLGMGGGLAIASGTSVTLMHATFAENYAKFHGGGIQMAGSSDARVAMGNCLFVNNRSDRSGGWANFHTNRAVDMDLGGNMQFLAANLRIDGNSDALVAAGATRADPKLGALADHGGPTATTPLAADSPAKNAGMAGKDVPEVDQRLKKRDAQPDIGAFEVVSP